MILRKIYQLISLFLLIFLVCGCSSLNDEKKAQKVFAIFALADKGRSSNMQAVLPYKNSDGKKVFVDVQRIPVMSPERIMHIEPTGFGDSNYALKLFLDMHGKMTWDTFSTVHKGQDLVLAIDGEAVALWTCQQYKKDKEYVYIDAEFSKDLAEELSKNSNSNYKKYHKKSWLGFLEDSMNSEN